MFNFASGDVAATERLMDIGIWPWWTFPEIHAAFFRPVAVASHWLDYQFWPDHPPFMHLHSVLWFAVLVHATTKMYRRFLGYAWTAGLAALLYAIDDARGMPVGFLANRNAILATLFGVYAVICHDRWRRDGWAPGAVLAPLLFAVSLLSSEFGIGAAAYLFAHALFIDRGGLRSRVLAMMPYVAVIAAWRVMWTKLGYGIWGVGFYVDPLREPLEYLAALFERAPVLVLGQFLLPPSDLHLLWVDLGLKWPCSAGALAMVVVIAAIMLPRLTKNAATRFWACGALMSLVPICSTFAADRLLFFVGLGGFALIADFVATVQRPQTERGLRAMPPSAFASARTLAILLIVVHLAIAPLALAVRSALPAGPPALVEKLQVKLHIGNEVERQSVVVINAPLPLLVGYLPQRRALEGLPVPAHTRVLAPCDPNGIVWSRPDANTIVIRPAGGFIAYSFDRLARDSDHAMAAGQRVELTGMTAEVLAVTDDGRPAEVAFHFDVPLEDPTLRWLCWGREGFEPTVPPPIGSQVALEHNRWIPFFD